MYVSQLYLENNGVKNPSLFSSLPLLYSTVMHCGVSNMNLSCKTCYYSAESSLGNSQTVSISQWNMPVAKNTRVERIWVCTGILFVCYVGFSRSGTSCWQRSANIALGKWNQPQWATMSHTSQSMCLLFDFNLHCICAPCCEHHRQWLLCYLCWSVDNKWVLRSSS